MKTLTLRIGTTTVETSRLAYGCWRIAGTEGGPVDGRGAVVAAFEAGYRLFDLADIYGRGRCEEIFGQVLREVSGMREQLVIATKCGIRPGGWPRVETPPTWDFSAGHIVSACEGSLRRLGVETVDILMLHRPDYLADPAEVASAFDRLHAAGKVRFFGVSNFRPSLLAAVQAACPLPLAVHQVEISLAKLDAFTDGTLDQCLAGRITPMAWSPLAGGLLADGASRLLPAQRDYRVEQILTVLDHVAGALGVDRTAVALAWLMQHPSGIMPVVGSTDSGRIRSAVAATGVELARPEWYRLLAAAQGAPLP